MAIISFKAEKGDGFKIIPGTYEASIDAIEARVSKATDNEYFAFKFKGEGFGSIFHNVTDSPYGRRDLYKIYEACGIDPESEEVDSEELIDIVVMITIEQDGTYNDKPQYRVKDIKPYVDEDEDVEEDEEEEEEEEVVEEKPKAKKKPAKKPLKKKKVVEDDDEDDWDL